MSDKSRSSQGDHLDETKDRVGRREDDNLKGGRAVGHGEVEAARKLNPNAFESCTNLAAPEELRKGGKGKAGFAITDGDTVIASKDEPGSGKAPQKECPGGRQHAEGQQEPEAQNMAAGETPAPEGGNDLLRSIEQSVESVRQGMESGIRSAHEHVEMGFQAMSDGMSKEMAKLQSDMDAMGRFMQRTWDTQMGVARNTADILVTGAEEAVLTVGRMLTGGERLRTSPDEVAEELERLNAGNYRPCFSEIGQAFTDFANLPTRDQQDLVAEMNRALGGDRDWIIFQNQAPAAAHKVDLSAPGNDAVDHKYAGEDVSSYNCFAYALDKAGIHEPWMDGVRRQDRVIDGDLLARHCIKADAQHAQKGDLVLLRNELGGYLHAAVVEGVDQNGDLIIRQKPSAGQLAKTEVNDQNLNSFAATWTGKSYDPSLIEIWHPGK